MDLNDQLMRAAKRLAADEGIPLRRVIESALRTYLAGPSKQGDYKLLWRTERGRLQPGVRLEDRDALFDFMGGRP